MKAELTALVVVPRFVIFPKAKVLLASFVVSEKTVSRKVRISPSPILSKTVRFDKSNVFSVSVLALPKRVKLRPLSVNLPSLILVNKAKVSVAVSLLPRFRAYDRAVRS